MANDSAPIPDGNTFWCIMLFDSAATKEGHFLWPRFRHTGPVIAVGRFQVVGIVDTPQNLESGLKQACLKAIDELMEKKFLKRQEPVGFGVLDPEQPPDDNAVRQLIHKLRQTNSGVQISIEPPDNMTPEEHQFYQKNGF